MIWILVIPDRIVTTSKDFAKIHDKSKSKIDDQRRPKRQKRSINEENPDA